MDCQLDSFPFALHRCGPGTYNRIILLNACESGTHVGKKSDVEELGGKLFHFVYSGRSEESVSLNSLYVSRQHIHVFYKSSKWYLMDLHSFNNTFLYQDGNAQKIEAFMEYEM